MIIPSRRNRLDPLPVPRDDPGLATAEDARATMAQRYADEKFQEAMMLSGAKRTGPVAADPNDTSIPKRLFASAYVPSASSIST
jgi:hypothetical protein